MVPRDLDGIYKGVANGALRRFWARAAPGATFQTPYQVQRANGISKRTEARAEA